MRTTYTPATRRMDGRTTAARRMRAVVAAVTGAAPSEHRLTLARRYAALVLQAEQMEARLARGEPIDSATHVRITGTIMRLSRRIRSEATA